MRTFKVRTCEKRRCYEYFEYTVIAESEQDAKDLVIDGIYEDVELVGTDDDANGSEGFDIESVEEV